jgi:hypothetical protein
VSEAGAKVFLVDQDLLAAEKVARTIQKKKHPCRSSPLPGFGCFQFYHRPYGPRRWRLAECLMNSIQLLVSSRM